MRTMAAEWADFEKTCVPAGAGATQRKEMRRAFYAGAASMLSVTVEISHPSVSENAGVAILEGLHDEYRRFGADIAAGRA